MRRVLRNGFLLLACMVLGAQALLGQRAVGLPRATGALYSPGFFGGYGGFELPFFAPIYAYQPPNYWWVSPYPTADPRQEAYNPSAGYDWDSVGTLILTTSPANARVTLDGTFVGTCDRLGPFQLPAGEYTLRVTAEGFEPADEIVKVDQPGPLLLDVQLQRPSERGEPTPRTRGNGSISE